MFRQIFVACNKFYLPSNIICCLSSFLLKKRIIIGSMTADWFQCTSAVSQRFIFCLIPSTMLINSKNEKKIVNISCIDYAVVLTNLHSVSSGEFILFQTGPKMTYFTWKVLSLSSLRWIAVNICVMLKQLFLL